MGEVATTIAAFQQQFNKAFASLQHTGKPIDHDAVQAYFLASRRLADILRSYSVRLPKSVSVTLLLRFGKALAEGGHHALARDLCYRYVLSLNMVRKATEQTYALVDRTRDHSQACIEASVCQFEATIREHPRTRRLQTAEQFVICLLVWPGQTCTTQIAARDQRTCSSYRSELSCR
jgi:hypothetical protein